MTIKTKSIYEPSSKDDGKRILITRYYPRGVKKSRFDLWVRRASPEQALLKEYRSGRISWGEFSKRFRRQLNTLPESREAINELASLARTGDITLLCYEREGENCHRYIVKSKLDQLVR